MRESKTTGVHATAGEKVVGKAPKPDAPSLAALVHRARAANAARPSGNPPARSLASPFPPSESHGRVEALRCFECGASVQGDWHCDWCGADPHPLAFSRSDRREVLAHQLREIARNRASRAIAERAEQLLPRMHAWIMGMLAATFLLGLAASGVLALSGDGQLSVVVFLVVNGCVLAVALLAESHASSRLQRIVSRAISRATRPRVRGDRCPECGAQTELERSECKYCAATIFPTLGPIRETETRLAMERQATAPAVARVRTHLQRIEVLLEHTSNATAAVVGLIVVVAVLLSLLIQCGS